MKIHIRNTDLLSGLKHYFGTLVRDMESDVGFSFKGFFILLFIIPFLYPLLMLDILLVVLSYSLTTTAFNTLTALLIGPMLYTILVLPVLLHLEKQQRKESQQHAYRVNSKLLLISLFTDEEVNEYSIHLTSRKAPDIIYNFIMFVIGFVTLLLFTLFF